MKKIPNVFLAIPNYNCFGCSPANSIGLKLDFFAHEDGLCTTEYTPQSSFSGFPGILHGGIASTLLDELAFWTVYAETNRFGLTASLNLKFKKATPIGVELLCKGRVISKKGRLVNLSVSLTVKNTGEETVSGNILYFLATKENWEKVTGMPVHPSITDYLG